MSHEGTHAAPWPAQCPFVLFPQSWNLGLFQVTCAHLELWPCDPVLVHAIQIKLLGRITLFQTKMQRLAGRRLFVLCPFNFPFYSCLVTGSDAWRHCSLFGAMKIKATAMTVEKKSDELGSRMSPWIVPPAQDCPPLSQELN